MCKKAGFIVGFDMSQKRAVVARANCDSWSCEECAARMKEEWIYRAVLGAREILARGEMLDFCTITSHERLKNWEQTVFVFKKAWPALYASLKRHCCDLMYFVVPEQHKDGRLHVHALWNDGLTKKELKNAARARGLGHQCDVQHVTEPSHAVSYVTKYCAKSLGAADGKRVRRVRVTRNWPKAPSASKTNDLIWCYIADQVGFLCMYEYCDYFNIDLVNQKTGEPWDDGDAVFEPLQKHIGSST